MSSRTSGLGMQVCAPLHFLMRPRHRCMPGLLCPFPAGLSSTLISPCVLDASNLASDEILLQATVLTTSSALLPSEPGSRRPTFRKVSWVPTTALCTPFSFQFFPQPRQSTPSISSTPQEPFSTARGLPNLFLRPQTSACGYLPSFADAKASKTCFKKWARRRSPRARKNDRRRANPYPRRRP